MRKCKICGAKIPVGAPCCPQCGAVDLQKERFDGHHVFQDSLDHMSGNPYEEDGYAPEDIRQNKGMALLSYLVSWSLFPFSPVDIPPMSASMPTKDFSCLSAALYCRF